MISHKSVQKTPFLVFIIAGILILVGSASSVSRAQSTATIRTDLGVYPEPAAPPLPPARGKFVDPTFGTEIMRVTDERDGQYNGTEYSYWSTLNCNSTRLLVASSGGNFVLNFDATNFVVTGQKLLVGSGSFGGAGGFPHTAGATWSTTDPDVLYSVDGISPRLMAFNVSTMQSVLLHDFTAALGGLGPRPFIFQLSVSGDNDVFAATIFHDYSQPKGYIVWKRSTNQTLLRVDNVSPLNQNEARIDKTGNYLLVHNDGGDDTRDVWNLQTGTKTTITPSAPDYVPSHYDLGAGFIFAGDAYISKETKYELNSPHSATILLPVVDWTLGKHYSMLAANDNWGLISTYFVASSFVPTNIFKNEIYQLATDGTGRVRRFLHHHSIYSSYYDTPRANISRDGRFVAFTSNWGVPGGRHDLFIAQIAPADGSNPTPTPTPIPSPRPTPLPTPTPTPRIPSLGETVIRAKEEGQSLANRVASSGGGGNFGSANALQANSAEQVALELFIAEIQKAYAYFNADRGIYPAAPRIDTELDGALQRALQARYSFAQNDVAGFRNNLRQAIGHLELSVVLITQGNVDNPIDVASYVVRQHYVDFLDREPERSGNEFWVNQFSACGTDARCFEDRRIHVSAAFFLSIEFQQTGYFVHGLYKSSYGRVPSIVEFTPDNAVMGQGVIVGTAGWEARLAANKDQFLQSWVQRADFNSRYAYLTNGQYVDALIANLGVTIDPKERDALILDLANGASRANVLGRIAQNEVFSRSELNSAFVLMQYFGYLRRDPDGAGFNFWLNKLNQFAGNYQRAEMVKAFLASQEYRTRFAL